MTKKTYTQTSVRESVRRVIRSGRFAPASFPLPAEDGGQLSLTGAPGGWGNGGGLEAAGLIPALRSFPTMAKTAESELVKYAARRRFFLFPGDGDRFVAAADAASALFASGILKLVVAADTPAERDNLVRFLGMAQPGDASVRAYMPGESEGEAIREITASVFSFLTSAEPGILVLSRDTFSRRTNLIRRPLDEASGESLCSLTAQARPVVICSAKMAESARTLARLSEIFDPPAAFLIAGEDRSLREAVIFRPGKRKKSPAKQKAEPEEMDVMMEL